jgi:hypothetical protein
MTTTDWKCLKKSLTWLALLGVLALSLAVPALGALPPGAPDELKALAPEVLDVEIIGVEAGRPQRGRFPVLYEARVLDVLRTAEGISAGDRIEIDTFSVRDDAALVGPKPPPLLSTGWRGRVWLKPVPPTGDERGTPRFLPAAYGHGFEVIE